jgi:WD40 repeat protein
MICTQAIAIDGAILTAHAGGADSVAFSPDGKLLATAGRDNTVKLWHTATRELAATLTGHERRVYVVAFSPDGRQLVSTSRDKTARLWKIDGDASGVRTTLVSTVRGNRDPVFASAAFLPDGKTLAFGCDVGEVMLWDIAAARELARLPGHRFNIHSIAVSVPVGMFASASQDATVRLWKVSPGARPTELATLKAENSRDAVYAAAFSPKGDLVATGSDGGAVKLWDTGRRELLATVKAHGDDVHAVAFAPAGDRLASGGLDGLVKLIHWPPGRPAEAKVFVTLDGHGGDDVMSVAFSPDGRLIASAAEDGKVRLWDARAHQPPTILAGHTKTINALAISPNGRDLATAGDDQTVRLWDLSTGREHKSIALDAPVQAVAWSPDGATIATGGNDKLVRLWNASTYAPLASLKGHASHVQCVAFSPDSKALVSGGADATVRVWSVAEASASGAALSGHRLGVRGAAFIADDRFITAGEDKNLALWKLGAKSPLATVAAHKGPVVALAASPDRRTLASVGGDGVVRLWTVAAAGLEAGAVFAGHKGAVVAVAFSPDGKTLATSGRDGLVKLWDAATGRELTSFAGHDRYVSCLGFSPDGGSLVTGSVDKTARIWRLGATAGR